MTDIVQKSRSRQMKPIPLPEAGPSSIEHRQPRDV